MTNQVKAALKVRWSNLQESDLAGPTNEDNSARIQKRTGETKAVVDKAIADAEAGNPA